MELGQNIGDWGHLMLLLSFVSLGLACCGYVGHARTSEPKWWRYAVSMSSIHAFSLLVAAGLLSYLLISDRFEYHYPWSHSMASLPFSYKFASFWEGQEGSFLLWMMAHLLLGAVLIKVRGKLQTEALAILSLTQWGLSSMLLGVVIGDWKVGSSPFLLLREVIDAPIFDTNPNFLPKDGMGLSPLLQNYWMVIHPPVLFMGFAMVSVPFAYVCAGLWKKDLKAGLKRAFPWVIGAVAVLGIGIAMGAIWAYETLNFGGYWNWDPVENAVYVPWLVLIVALHLMILSIRKGLALRGSVYAVFMSFWLILYATFLIRSGVLGNSSVHAFTDAGLSGQLIGFVVLMVGVGVLLMYQRRKLFPKSKWSYRPHKVDVYLVLGASCVALMAFQVLLPTSIPVFNALVGLWGVDSKLAPPADPVIFYSRTQLYFAALLMLLSGAGQLIYWKQAKDQKSWLRFILNPLVGALLVSALVIVFWGIQRLDWMLLLAAGCYALIANGEIAWRLLGQRPSLCGGALAHLGIACIVLGILFSSGYAQVISTNQTGLIWHKDFPDEVNENDILLFQYQKRQMQGYSLLYQGIHKRLKGVPVYVPAAYLVSLGNPLLVRTKVNISTTDGAQLYARKGDTLQLEVPVKDYFKIIYQSEAGETELIYPNAQPTEEEQGIIYGPYILRKIWKDIYTHVRTFSDPEEIKWSDPQTLNVQPRSRFFVNDYAAKILGIEQIDQLEGLEVNKNDILLRAQIEVLGPDGPRYAEPVLILQESGAGSRLGLISDEIVDLGLHISLKGLDPDRDRVELQIRTTQSPWVILEVVQKPFINLLWGGLVLLVVGLGWSLSHRLRGKQK